MRHALTALLAFSVVLTPEATAQVRLPNYTREVLPNGATLLIVPKSGVPLVHLRVVIRGGEESEPAELAGLSAVTAALLQRGTETRTADQFSAELDSLGATFRAATDRSSTIISEEFLKKDLDHALALAADAIGHPSFPDPETSKELAQRIDAAAAQKDNAQQAIGSYTRAAFYGVDHPYGHPASEITLRAIRRQHILDYYARIYRGRNLIIALSGDVDPAAARASIARQFGAIPIGSAYAWQPAPELRRRAGLVLVDKPDATQTYFQIVQPGVDRKSPDRAALDLINTRFGGQFTSMLNDELRVQTGLTYGANSSVELQRLPGEIVVSTYTKTATTEEAIDRALAILKRLGETGLTAEQLAAAKAYVKGQFPTRHLETAVQLASAVTDMELLNLGRDEIDAYFQRIDAVTLAQANAIAHKYYRSDALLLVLIGQASQIREATKKYSPSPILLRAETPGWR